MDGAVAIVLAAGLGERMHAEVPKALMAFDGTTIVARAVERALACPSVSSAVVVAPAGWEDAVRALVEPLGVSAVVTGGATRQASVTAALSVAPPDATRIVCHDAARPLATAALFERALEALDGWDGVVPVVGMVDTVKRIRDGAIEGTEPRDTLAIAQTPRPSSRPRSERRTIGPRTKGSRRRTTRCCSSAPGSASARSRASGRT